MKLSIEGSRGRVSPAEKVARLTDGGWFAVVVDEWMDDLREPDDEGASVELCLSANPLSNPHR